MDNNTQSNISQGPTKECKHCKSIIQKSAKVCPMCRKKQGGIAKWIGLAVVALIFISAIAGNGSKTDTSQKAQNNDSNSNITATAVNTVATSTPDTATPTVATTTETVSSDAPKALISEQVLLEYEGLKITAKEIVTDSFWGDGLKLLIENDSDKDLGIRCNALIINNYMISELFSSKIAAGKKANETMYFSSSQLEAAGITNVAQIEIYFHIYDADSYSTIYDADCATIQTSEYKNMDTTSMSDGNELLNQDGIRIVGKYVNEDSFWGAAVLLYIENNSGRNVGVSCNDMSINGFMITPFFSSTVYNSKMSIDDITIMASDLEENGIEKISDIELKFKVYDADSYSTIFETEPISFSVQ